MGVFVPENGVPIVLPGMRLGGRGIHRDEVPKTNPQIARPAKCSEGTDGEIFLLRIDLQQGGVLGFVLVLLVENSPGFLEQVLHIRTVNFGFLCIHQHLGVLVLQYGKFLMLFVKLSQVESCAVVGVFFTDFGGQFPTFGFLAGAEKILGQLQLGREVIGLEFQGSFLVLGTFLEVVLCGELATDVMMGLWVLGIVPEGLLQESGGGSCIVAKLGNESHVRPCKWMPWVGVQNGVCLDQGFEDLFRVDVVFSKIQTGSGMAWVDLEYFFQVFDGFRPVVRKLSLGQPVEEFRGVGVELESFLELGDG